MNPTPSGSQEAVQETAVPTTFSLDVLRGKAILGLLITSIWGFAGFGLNEQTFYFAAAHGGNYKLLYTISVLLEGKMTALLAIVFGAGIVLFLHKKEKHPVSIGGPDAFIRQQIWFILLGLFTAFIIISPDDLLFPFGIVGILLFAFWKMPARSLLIAALICSFIYCGKNYWNYTEDKSAYAKYVAVTVVEKKFKQDSTTRAIKNNADSAKVATDPAALKAALSKIKLADSLAKKKDTLTGKQAEEKEAWEGIVKSLKYDSAKNAAQNKTMRSNYNKIWSFLNPRIQRAESYGLYSIGVWNIASMMLLGMALLGFGFFSRRFSATKHFVIGLVLIAAGIFLAYYRLCNTHSRIIDYTKFIQDHAIPYNLFQPLEHLIIATGYASLIMWWVQLGVLKWTTQVLAAVGRMALTNYILQTVICAFWFYGYGLGYWGRFHQAELYFVVLEITLVQVVFSIFWLRAYRMGPLEWALQSLIHRKSVPMKNPPVSEAETTFTN